MKCSYQGILDAAESSSVRSRLDQLDLKAYIDLLPSNVEKRVTVALLSKLESQTYLLKRGISVMRQRLATQRVDLALLATAELEQRAIEAFRVPTDVTAEGGAKRLQRLIKELEHDALADAHGGGHASLLEQATDLGVELGPLIERTAAQLSSLNYSTAHDGGLRVSAQRDSTAMHRNCTYDAIAAGVEEKLQAAQAKAADVPIMPDHLKIKVSENTIRLHCLPVQAIVGPVCTRGSERLLHIKTCALPSLVSRRSSTQS